MPLSPAERETFSKFNQFTSEWDISSLECDPRNIPTVHKGLLKKYSFSEEVYNQYADADTLCKNFLGINHININNPEHAKVLSEFLNYTQTFSLQHCSLVTSRFILDQVENKVKRVNASLQDNADLVTVFGSYNITSFLVAPTVLYRRALIQQIPVQARRKLHAEYLDKIDKQDISLQQKVGLYYEPLKTLDLPAELQTLYVIKSNTILHEQKSIEIAEFKKQITQEINNLMEQRITPLTNDDIPSSKFNWESTVNTTRGVYFGAALIVEHLGKDPETANKIILFGNAGIAIASAARDIIVGSASAGPLMPYVALASSLIYLAKCFSESADVEPLNILMKGIHDLSNSIKKLEGVINQRLNNIDKQLLQQELLIIEGFSKLNRNFRDFSQRIDENHTAVINSLNAIQSKMYEGFRNIVLRDFQHNYANAMTDSQASEISDLYDKHYKYFRNAIAIDASNPYVTGQAQVEINYLQQYDDLNMVSAVGSSTRYFVPEANIAYFSKFLGDDFFTKYQLSPPGNPIIYARSTHALIALMSNEIILNRQPSSLASLHGYLLSLIRRTPINSMVSPKQMNYLEEIAPYLINLRRFITLLRRDKNLLINILQSYKKNLENLKTAVKTVEDTYIKNNILQPLKEYVEGTSRSQLDMLPPVPPFPDPNNPDHWYGKFNNATKVAGIKSHANELNAFRTNHQNYLTSTKNNYEKELNAILAISLPIFDNISASYNASLLPFLFPTNTMEPINRLMLPFNDHVWVKKLIPPMLLEAERLGLGYIFMQYSFQYILMTAVSRHGHYYITGYFKTPSATHRFLNITITIQLPVTQINFLIPRYRDYGLTSSSANFSMAKEALEKFPQVIKLDEQVINSIKNLVVQERNKLQTDIRKNFENELNRDKSELQTTAQQMGTLKFALRSLLTFSYRDKLISEPLFRQVIDPELGLDSYMALKHLLTVTYSGFLHLSTSIAQKIAIIDDFIKLVKTLEEVEKPAIVHAPYPLVDEALDKLNKLMQLPPPDGKRSGSKI